MAKITKPTGNNKLVMMIGAFGAMLLLWWLGEQGNAQLAALPVKQAPRVGNNATVLDEKSFYPAWAKQPAATKAAVTNDVQVDDVFVKELPKAFITPKLAEPDYGKVFRESIRVDGIADDGLFINGHFYAVGAPIEALGIATTSGKTLVPVIYALKQNKATFKLGTQTMTLNLQTSD